MGVEVGVTVRGGVGVGWNVLDEGGERRTCACECGRVGGKRWVGSGVTH